jgi:type IV pilus assembly protein PilN
MIEINLLPVREARRKADLRQQGMSFVLIGILCAAFIGFAHSYVTDQISDSSHRIRQMEADIKQFQPQLDQVAAFRKKKAALEKKIDVIDGLDRARSGPVRMMDELASHMPERVWLTNIATEGSTIKMKGESLDNELVATLLRALGESPYFAKVDLQSTEIGTSNTGLKLVKFNVEAQIVTPKADVKAASKPASKG